MLNLVLVAAALVSMQCGFKASAQLDSSKIDIDNNLNPNPEPARRRLRSFASISLAPPAAAPAPLNAPLVLECQAYGSPAPRVAWLRNGESVADLEEDVNEILSIQPASIGRMTSRVVVTSPHSGDVFTCMARAGPHTDTATTTVYDDEGAGRPSDRLSLQLLQLSKVKRPIITSFYNELFTEQGSTVVLPCRAAGKAQVYWTDNKNQLIRNGQSLKHRVLPSGDLVIAGLRWSDMGQYSCSARNLYGKDTASTFLYPTKPAE